MSIDHFTLTATCVIMNRNWKSYWKQKPTWTFNNHASWSQSTI